MSEHDAYKELLAASEAALHYLRRSDDIGPTSGGVYRKPSDQLRYDADLMDQRDATITRLIAAINKAKELNS